MKTNKLTLLTVATIAPVTLPNTGSEFGIAISLLGMLGLSLGAFGIAAKKEN